MSRTNSLGQPIGVEIQGWAPRPMPSAVTLFGRYCRVERLDAERHGKDLFYAYSQAVDDGDWTYMFVGPFKSYEEYHTYLVAAASSTDPLQYVVIDQITNVAVGTIALMRIDPQHGVIEVGGVTFSPLLKKSRLSTEAQYLVMSYVFDHLGYRRYEWKCDDLNVPSRKAALRLGFIFEGVFRRAVIYKGRNRDTAWYAIIDEDWPRLKNAFQSWLSPENFDHEGRQICALSSFQKGESSFDR